MDTQANDGNASTRLRFNLRTLLMAFAVLSIPLTLLHWLGQYFVVPIIFSSCLAGICYWNYRVDAPKRVLAIAGLAIPVGVVFSILYLMASFRVGGTGSLILHTVINVAVCAGCLLLKSPRLVVAPLLVVAAVAPYWLRISEIQQVRHRFDAMLANHPLESLEGRLKFETAARGKTESDVEPMNVTLVNAEQLSTVVLSNLDEQAQRGDRGRQRALQQLHENFRSQFAAAAGFGYMRMMRIWPEDLEPLPVDIVQMPMPVSSRFLGVVESAGANKLHRHVSFDFLNLGKIGYVRDKQHVAGFQSHSLTNLAEAISNNQSCGKSKVEDASWQLTRLELVSLLRHTPPRVYLAESLPAMDQLAHLEHRGLTEFEQQSIQRLQVEQDVVVQSEAGTMRMLGALRASQDCLDCHRGEKGRLLGAFSYEFTQLEGHDSAEQKLAIRSAP